MIVWRGCTAAEMNEIKTGVNPWPTSTKEMVAMKHPVLSKTGCAHFSIHKHYSQAYATDPGGGLLKLDTDDIADPSLKQQYHTGDFHIESMEALKHIKIAYWDGPGGPQFTIEPSALALLQQFSARYGLQIKRTYVGIDRIRADVLINATGNSFTISEQNEDSFLSVLAKNIKKQNLPKVP